MRDHVDVDGGEGWINDDWADMMVVAYMMGDLERDGRMFRTLDNGQAMLLFYLDAATTKNLAELAHVELKSVTDP